MEDGGTFGADLRRSFGPVLSRNLPLLLAQLRPEDQRSLTELVRAEVARLEVVQPPATAERLRAVVDTAVGPRWSTVPAREVTVSALDAWYHELAQPPGGGRRKPSAIKGIHGMLTNAVWAAVIDQLLGESLEVLAMTVPVWTASGTRLPSAPGVRLGSAFGNLIGRSTGRRGQGVAQTLPQVKGSWLVVGPTTVALVPGIAPAAVAWQLPREQVAAVEQRPHLQLLYRFRMTFKDGSSGDFMVHKQRRKSMEVLADELETTSKGENEGALGAAD